MAKKKIDNDMENKACQLSNDLVDSTVQTEVSAVDKKRKTKKTDVVVQTSTNTNDMSAQEKEKMRKRGEEALKAAFQESQQKDLEKTTVASSDKKQTKTTKETVSSESTEVTAPKKTRRKKSASDINLANHENTVQNDSIKQVEEKVEDARVNSQMLSVVYERRGELVEYNGEQFIILESEMDGILAISARIIKEMSFDDSMKNNTNNWKTSKVRSWLNNTYIEKLNKEDLLPITTNLIADTGEKDRGFSEDFVAIPTDAVFRKYYDIIPTYINWVWSATPWAIEVGEGRYQSARSNNKCLYSLATYEKIGVVALVKFKPTAI